MSGGGHLKRTLSLVSLLACGALFAASSPAAAAVTIGQTFTPDVGWGGSGTIVQTASPGNSYVVPSDGVITKWSFEAAAETVPPLKLKILRPAGGNDYTTVGESQLETPTQAILNTWPTRISVKAGDLLGEYYSNDITPLREDLTFQSHEISSGPGDPSVDPPPGTTATYPPSTGNYQIDGSAVLEPDADVDAFGDESQDKCLGTPGNFNGCPSAFELNSIKQKRGAKKITVNLTVPGAGGVAVGSPGDAALASAAGKKLKAKRTTETVTGKHGVALTLKLTKATARRLAASGKVKVKVQAVYTPPGGPPASLTAKKKLKS